MTMTLQALLDSLKGPPKPPKPDNSWCPWVLYDPDWWNEPKPGWYGRGESPVRIHGLTRSYQVEQDQFGNVSLNDGNSACCRR